MTGNISITRRLIATVLVLELLSAISLIVIVAFHERHVQLKALDASLVATAESLAGAVQDAGDEADNVMLDLQEVQIGKDAAFRVEDEQGRLLGSEGETPGLEMSTPGEPAFRNVELRGRAYRFLLLHRLRIVDPGNPDGGVRHPITVVYGTPVGHVWHEVLEAIRFYSIATAILIGVTATLMIWLLRKGLAPVYELAHAAERVSSSDWRFDAPASAKRTVELQPLTLALEAALARLQRSFEQQRRFTNDAAHELKTDVAIVKSSLQLLSMRKRTIDEYIRGLTLSLNDFTRLESTVQKMLTLARLEQRTENGGLGAAFHSCSLGDAIEDSVNQIKAFAELKVIDVQIESIAIARVPIDSRDAFLLCSNILLNAVQHSPDGSTVRIAMNVNEQTVSLTVKDQGEGISDQDCLHIFEPFYRGDPSRSRKSGGTGLGLSICKAICERVGGTIEIANSVSGGALVTVTLPVEALGGNVCRLPSASLKAP
jgi:two-component system OmpR family sensor kinase